MESRGSYRQILRSSSIIGGASVINILVGLLRMKVAAVLLGPAGVGLIGLLQSVMATTASVAALGFSNAGTRQIADAAGRGDEAVVAAARRALFWGTLILASTGAIAVFHFRDMLATQLLNDPGRGPEVGWLALGVALTVASGSQGALLNGLRRIGDLALVSVGSAILSTAIGIAALWFGRERGLLLFVVAAPLATFLLGHWCVARAGRLRAPPTPLPELAAQWRALVKLGFAFMVSGLVVALGQLAVRTMVQRELGGEALGHFQAAWIISMSYIGFVLGAMGADYFPRLTAVIDDHAAANRLVNEQTEIALLLAGPVLLAMLGLAPWVISLLYSDAFAPAAEVLCWQILGDVLKVASWPLGFVILASGDGKTFILTETVSMTVFVALTWLLLPLVGVRATGLAFLCMYLSCLPVVYWLARRRVGFAWWPKVRLNLLLLLLAASTVFFVSDKSPISGAIVGLVSSVLFAVFAVIRLATIADLTGPLGSVATNCKALLSRLHLFRK